jgi:hypothetical protein
MSAVNFLQKERTFENGRAGRFFSIRSAISDARLSARSSWVHEMVLSQVDLRVVLALGRWPFGSVRYVRPGIGSGKCESKYASAPLAVAALLPPAWAFPMMS